MPKTAWSIVRIIIFFKRKKTCAPSGTGGTITLTADNDIFSPDYVGSRIRINEGEVKITAYVNAKQLTGETPAKT